MRYWVLLSVGLRWDELKALQEETWKAGGNYWEFAREDYARFLEKSGEREEAALVRGFTWSPLKKRVISP